MFCCKSEFMIVFNFPRPPRPNELSNLTSWAWAFLIEFHQIRVELDSPTRYLLDISKKTNYESQGTLIFTSHHAGWFGVGVKKIFKDGVGFKQFLLAVRNHLVSDAARTQFPRPLGHEEVDGLVIGNLHPKAQVIHSGLGIILVAICPDLLNTIYTYGQKKQNDHLKTMATRVFVGGARFLSSLKGGDSTTDAITSDPI